MGFRDEHAILTPDSPTLWGVREALATHFAILPATLDGLKILAAYFDLSVQEAQSLNAAIVEPCSRSADDTDRLRRYLGDDAFQWLCPCAIYPELQWD